MKKSIIDLEKEADEKTKQFMKVYSSVKDKKKAYDIFIKVAEGKIPYEQGLKELRKLAQG